MVTGGSAGIGLGICAHLLQHNAEKIYMLSNKADHAHETIEELADWGNTSKIIKKKCDFKELKQVRSIGEELAKLPQINALSCNAGLGVGVYNESIDGINTLMQVNVFAQNMIVGMLLPVLFRTPN